MVERIEFAFGSGGRGPAPRRDGERLRVLVMGAFAAPAAEEPAFTALPAGVDGLSATLERLAPSVSLGGEVLTITSLDHFHPDHWIESLPPLRRLLELHRRLGDRQTQAGALAELERMAVPTAAASPASPSGGPVASDGTPARGAPAETVEQLFGRLLGGAPGGDRDAGHAHSRGTGGASASTPQTRETVRKLIESAMGAGAGEKPAADPRAADAARDALATELTRRCRAVLAEPGFRELERAWGSLHWLVSRLEDGAADVCLMDVSKAALAAHLEAFRSRLDASPLNASLNDPERRWDLIVTDYSFGLRVEDLLLLATLGALAPAPIIGHGELSLAGCPSENAVDRPWEWALPDDELGAMWREFRRHPAARRVALATPRFLLRHPYGARSAPLASFPFEELPDRPERSSFSWANPSFACACVAVAGAARDDGDGTGAGSGFVEGLPMPVVGQGADRETRPCVEYLLSERAAAAAAQSGLIVCTGGRNADRMAVAPARTLSGEPF